MAFETENVNRNETQTRPAGQGGDSAWLRPEHGVGRDEPGRPDAKDAAQRTAALYELRPLSLGEILDRTFALYRSHFWLFAGITAVSASVQVVVQAISLATSHTMMRRLAVSSPGTVPPIVALHGILGAQLGTWIAAIAFILVAAIANAATTLALSEVYLNQPAGAKQALGVAFRRWYRWIGIGLWQAGSMIWIFALTIVVGALLNAYGMRVANGALGIIGGILVVLAVIVGWPAGFVLYLRNCLAIPAAMIERLTVREAMRRSKVLAAGTKGRIFMVLLITAVLYMVVAVLESPASYFMLMAPKQEHYIAQAITLLISFVGHTVVAPVGLIGLTLLYFDERVRKEALDLQLLLEGSRSSIDIREIPGTQGTSAAAAPPMPPPASEEFTSLG